jgi:putative flavoprotein involved in K+ transport
MTPQAWLSAFAFAIADRDIPAVTGLFHETCYWRDLLAFTWNIKTMEGRPAIAAMLAETLSATSPSDWRITGPADTDGSQDYVWLGFETATAHGIGRVTLRDGRAFTLMTAISDLKGHEERRGLTRPAGVVGKADRKRRTWTEERAAQKARLGVQDQPYTLIIGGGQGGLALGARLKQLGVPTLIVEKNARAGDSWRNRYRSLVLHDPVWYDHLPYLPFPENWPVFTPKDKMGDWLEAYASIFELDLWTSAVCNTARWNEATQDWTATVSLSNCDRSNLCLPPGPMARPSSRTGLGSTSSGVRCSTRARMVVLPLIAARLRS